MSRPWSVGKHALALGAVVLLLPHRAVAQDRAEFTPFLGSYYHTTHVATGDNGPFVGNSFKFDQTNAIAVGGRLSVPLGGRVSIEGEFAYSPSGVQMKEKDALGAGLDGGLSAAGNILYGSVRAVFSPRRSNLFLLAGPAVIHRGGDAWDGFSKLTDFGGVAGFGFRANVTPRFRLNVTAETYLYSLKVGGFFDTSKFQADLLLSIGVPISLSH